VRSSVPRSLMASSSTAETSPRFSSEQSSIKCNSMARRSRALSRNSRRIALRARKQVWRCSQPPKLTSAGSPGALRAKSIRPSVRHPLPTAGCLPAHEEPSNKQR